MFDTGSSMVYILTDKCDKALCPQENKYSTLSGGSYKADSDGVHDALAKCYGQGCVKGSVSKDTICFGGAKDSPCIDGATFLAVDEASDIDKDKFSGIVGLGPKSDQARMPAFVEQMGDLGGVGGQNTVTPIFSIYLSNAESAKGKIIFGGYDVAQYAKSGLTEKDIYWANQAHKTDYFWTLNMGQISFGDGTKFTTDSNHLIIDSGVSYSLIPSADFNNLTQLLEKKYGVTCGKKENADKKKEGNTAQANPSDCTCKDISSLPSLKFNLLAFKEDTHPKEI